MCVCGVGGGGKLQGPHRIGPAATNSNGLCAPAQPPLEVVQSGERGAPRRTPGAANAAARHEAPGLRASRRNALARLSTSIIARTPEVIASMALSFFLIKSRNSFCTNPF